MNVRSEKSFRYLASATVLALGLALGFGLAQIGAAEAGLSGQEVSRTSLTDPAADLPDLVPQGIFVDVADQVTPAVVYIQSEHRVRMPRGGNLNTFFRRFFDENDLPEDHPTDPEFDPTQRSQGSGFLISDDGYVVTNAHVVSTYDVEARQVFEAESVEVTLANEEIYDAEIVGVDLGTDIAVIKIQGRDLPHVPFGSSDGARVGEWVMALGAPFGLTKTVSAGIISAKGRALGLNSPNAYQDYIQTDAAINPGNSGGPLVNLRGEVIGVNTLIITDGVQQQFAGVGFAAPVDMVRKVTDQLIANGRVIRGWLGVSISPVDRDMVEALGLDYRELRGAVILPDVHEGGPAAAAGLQPYDIVTGMNGEELDGNQDFLARIALSPPGETVDLTVVRDEDPTDQQGPATRHFEVTLDERPDEIDVFADSLGANARPPVTRPEPEERRGSEAARNLGFEVEALTPAKARELGISADGGVLVSRVVPSSPAARATPPLQAQMVILSVNRVPVGSVADLEEQLAGVGPGQAVLFRVAFAGGTGFVAVRMPE